MPYDFYHTPELATIALRVISKGSNMTCREFVEFLWRYIDNDLSPGERSTFDDHLTKCPHCVKYLQQYQATTQAGKAAVAASDNAVPADVPEDLVQAILHARAKSA
jgi:anti-sigma factor RsiW